MLCCSLHVPGFRAQPSRSLGFHSSVVVAWLQGYGRWKHWVGGSGRVLPPAPVLPPVQPGVLTAEAVGAYSFNLPLAAASGLCVEGTIACGSSAARCCQSVVLTCLQYPACKDQKVVLIFGPRVFLYRQRGVCSCKVVQGVRHCWQAYTTLCLQSQLQWPEHQQHAARSSNSSVYTPGLMWPQRSTVVQGCLRSSSGKGCPCLGPWQGLCLAVAPGADR
jgi:hypothetical protein